MKKALIFLMIIGLALAATHDPVQAQMGPGMMGQGQGYGGGQQQGTEQEYGRGYGWGHGCPGPGMMGGYGMGPGMMHGWGGYGMGPGMMGGYGMGPGMMHGYGMGPGMMHGYGMGPGMMHGYGMGPGMMHGWGGYGHGRGYGPMPQQFLDETREQRRNLHMKMFDYMEEMRKSEPDQEKLKSMRGDIWDIKKQIYEKYNR